MSGFGSFSQEAYEQLQAAYAAQLAEADAVESAGVKIGSDTLGVETAPFKADWLDKTGLWKYPDGKGDYADRKQSPEDLLAALRNAEGEVEMPAAEDDSEDTDLSDLSDEELNSMVDGILGEIEAEETAGEDGDEEMTDEELDSFIDNLLAGVDPDEIENMTDEELDAFLAAALEDSDEEQEDRDFNTEGMGDLIGEEEDGDDAISIAEKIAALKEELAMLSSSLETEEEPEADVEEEPETTEAVEETDSDEQEEPVEEETSDDEPA